MLYRPHKLELRRPREVFDTALGRILLTAACWRFPHQAPRRYDSARRGSRRLVGAGRTWPWHMEQSCSINAVITSSTRDPSFMDSLTDVACCKARQQDWSASTEASSLALDESQLQPWRHVDPACSICAHKAFLRRLCFQHDATAYQL